MASTGVIVLGVVVVAGAAAFFTKPDADGFAPAYLAASGDAAAPAAADVTAEIESVGENLGVSTDGVAEAITGAIGMGPEACGENIEDCAAALRTAMGDNLSESDYFVVRTASMTAPDGETGSCLGAFGNWWC